jgi:hypothetical protein
MVEQAPSGALDPTSSAYLFHSESAAARGETTQGQNESMGMAEDAAREARHVPTTSETATEETVPPVPGTTRGRELT